MTDEEFYRAWETSLREYAALGDYLSELMENEKMNKIPELKPGDVFKDKNGRWILVVTAEEGYSLWPTDGSALSAQCVLENYTPIKIYRKCNGRLFAVESLVKIVAGAGAYIPFWEASKSPVEMTVDEVSEKLGYTVKIVGEKK